MTRPAMTQQQFCINQRVRKRLI